MKTSKILIVLSVISWSLLIPPQIYADDATNFIWGADSSGSTTGLTGSRTEVTVMSSTTHSFEFTNEDHNYHLEQWGSAAGSTWQYLVGYFVNEEDPTEAYCFAEVFKASSPQDSFECTTTYSHGNPRTFAIHKPGNTVTFYDGTGSGDDIWDYNTNNNDSMSNSNIWALAEKICPGTTCDANDLGDSPTVLWEIAMQYTSDSSYGSASWSDVTTANMHYTTKPFQSQSDAQQEMCAPMTAVGSEQSGVVVDNEMGSFDDSGVTCTSHSDNLWE